MRVLGQYRAELVDTYWVSMGRYWLVLGGTGSVWGGTGWYLVLGQYNFVLLGIKWYQVSKGLLCLYILKKVEIWLGRTDKQTNKERQGYSAIGLWKAEMSKKYSWICFYKFQRNQRRSQSSSLKVFAEVIFAILSCSNFWKLACFYQIKVQKVFFKQTSSYFPYSISSSPYHRLSINHK